MAPTRIFHLNHLLLVLQVATYIKAMVWIVFFSSLLQAISTGTHNKKEHTLGKWKTSSCGYCMHAHYALIIICYAGYSCSQTDSCTPCVVGPIDHSASCLKHNSLLGNLHMHEKNCELCHYGIY